MGKTAFANLIISNLKSAIGVDGSTYTADTPTKAQKAIAGAITEYLKINTSVKISYKGVLTSGTGADSVTEDVMKISGECKEIGKPSDFSTWVNDIQSAIASSFFAFSPGKNGVSVNFMPFNPTAKALTIRQSELLSACQSNTNAPVQVVWEVICGKILDWLNSELGKNPMVMDLPATRAETSAGTASLVSISVS